MSTNNINDYLDIIIKSDVFKTIEHEKIRKLINKLTVQNLLPKIEQMSFESFLNQMVIPLSIAFRTAYNTNNIESLPIVNSNNVKELIENYKRLIQTPRDTSQDPYPTTSFKANNDSNSTNKLLEDLELLIDPNTENTASALLDSATEYIENINQVNENEITELHVENKNALASGNPNFQSAPFDSIQISKKNRMVIIDIIGTDAGTIEKQVCQLLQTLHIYNESDVYIEFITFHALTTNSATSLENYHCFILEVDEFSDMANTISNKAYLQGKFIIPNETFGFKDTDDNVIHEGTVSSYTDAATTITLDTNASISDDTYNGNIITIISGTGNSQTKTITDYNGTTKVATIDSVFTTAPTNASKYIISTTAKMSHISTTVKLKSNFLFTIQPQKLSQLTISLSGLLKGSNNTESIKFVDANSRLQLGFLFKAR